MSIIVGDCREIMAAMPAASVDAVVCDPPYGLGFMGKEWDSPGAKGTFFERKDERRNRFDHVGGPVDSAAARTRRVEGQRFQAWAEEWAGAALRVLKPGAHLVAFGGTRTYHRLACALEDAGFEIRDCLCWLYGQGFPKSLDVSKAIDKAAGAEREIVGSKVGLPGYSLKHQGAGGVLAGRADGSLDNSEGECEITAPATTAAKEWQGWGTALKPAWEPIILARKPLAGTVATNVLAHGTGALNIDGCRIEVPSVPQPIFNSPTGRTYSMKTGEGRNGEMSAAPGGRWPANVMLDEEAAQMLDTQSGDQRDGVAVNRNRPEGTRNSWMGRRLSQIGPDVGYGGRGGASRFFYCAKASSSERHAAGKNNHPTVKPVMLMRWLCRLITLPGGLILDPFCGSGSTGVAAIAEGFRFVGIEVEEVYAEIARRRLAR